MSIIDNAAHVVPAIGSNAADATGVTGVFRVATTAGSVTHTLPADYRGVWVRAVSIGASTQYAFTLRGATAPTLVYNQAAAIGTGHAAAGATLIDGVEQQFRVPDNAVSVTVISSSTGGFFEIHVSGRTGG